MVNELEKIIREQHTDDDDQCKVIFSEENRLLVEAPAGYGKTTTMVSRIAYLLATNKIPNPKPILGLTFSVNAALKMKQDVAEKLPALFQNTKIGTANLLDRVKITNYHGLCKNILKKYGDQLDSHLKNIHSIRAINEYKLPNAKELHNIADTIQSGKMPHMDHIQSYNQLIKKHFLPKGYITHNAVMLLTLELLHNHPEIKQFYQSYYPLIMVDEFQDTNGIAWHLIESLITDKTQLFFIGDSLQRIYGFIGALPNIMEKAVRHYNMSCNSLTKNYRFRTNSEMIRLDENIRENAKSSFLPKIDQIAKLPVFWSDSQQSAISQSISQIRNWIPSNNKKIAVLFRNRDDNVITSFEQGLKQNNIPYFFGLFSEKDQAYIQFHETCLDIFTSMFQQSKNITRKGLTTFSLKVNEEYGLPNKKTKESLIILLESLIRKTFMDYPNLSTSEKYDLLTDIFANYRINQAMSHIDSPVILSTIHSAKGLEWDYVLLANMGRSVVPSYYECRSCSSDYIIDKCCIVPNTINENKKNKILDELSVFYVGATRAKEQFYVIADNTSIKSCFLSLEGIQLIKAKQDNLLPVKD